jgi:hypothetical protein
MKTSEPGPELDAAPGKMKADRSYKGYKGGGSAGNRWDGEIDPVAAGTKQVSQGRQAPPDLT